MAVRAAGGLRVARCGIRGHRFTVANRPARRRAVVLDVAGCESTARRSLRRTRLAARRDGVDRSALPAPAARRRSTTARSVRPRCAAARREDRHRPRPHGRRLSSIDCRPLAGARVHLWQANRRATYLRSGSATVVTDRAGRFRFEGPPPVSYEGRPPHIHLRGDRRRARAALCSRYVPAPGATRGIGPARARPGGALAAGQHDAERSRRRRRGRPAAARAAARGSAGSGGRRRRGRAPRSRARRRAPRAAPRTPARSSTTVQPSESARCTGTPRRAERRRARLARQQDRSGRASSPRAGRGRSRARAPSTGSRSALPPRRRLEGRACRRIGLLGDGPGSTAGERRGAGHAARALLRPDLRLRDHAGDRLRRRRPDLGRARRGPARARRALVGVGRVRLADEHDQPRGGRGADRDVRRDGRDAGRLARGAGRLRRRRAPLRVRLRLRPDRAPRRCTRSPAGATATCSRRSARLAVGTAIGVGLLFVAAALDGRLQVAVWALALAFDLLGAYIGGGKGWRLSAGHFAERHALIVIIALGETIVALGSGRATTSARRGRGRGCSASPSRPRCGGSTSTSSRSSRSGSCAS